MYSIFAISMTVQRGIEAGMGELSSQPYLLTYLLTIASDWPVYVAVGTVFKVAGALS